MINLCCKEMVTIETSKKISFFQPSQTSAKELWIVYNLKYDQKLFLVFIEIRHEDQFKYNMRFMFMNCSLVEINIEQVLTWLSSRNWR